MLQRGQVGRQRLQVAKADYADFGIFQCGRVRGMLHLTEAVEADHFARQVETGNL
ncbi:hypothetical protein D9M68_603970 [compost metagenome]